MAEMDDSCAVCAEALEWVAYGACGHREVCSTCVVRLRFVLEDHRCCICKTENPCVFVTKAMGDYTRVITDFSLLPNNATEGKAGEFWYHESTQAFFDDTDHYRMIRAMCRLSCSICDKNAEEQGSEATKRRSKFRNIEQLKGHLYHQHRLFMCSLCLEGRKVFICEQKLYTRSQLNQHISTGDSEVDGSESERGGFTGHPLCEFCKNPFYGDNELYMHMSTDHYTCHICQRQHPGQYDYYRNYDDLEIHFRQEHFLCENEACLAKKFIVFQTEAEMKRHNAIEHGGHMSRSKRNAVLQIPTSFRYRRSNEQEQRRGRGRGFRPDPSGDQLSVAIQASLETAVADNRARDQSSGARPPSENLGTSQAEAVSVSLEALNINVSSGLATGPPAAQGQNSRNAPVLEEISFPPLSDREPPELSSRYAQALSQNSATAARLGEESFPPLPGAQNSSKPKAKHGPGGLGQNTLATRLQLRNRVTVLHSARPRLSESSERRPSRSASSSQVRPTPSHGLSSSGSSSSQPWAAAAAQVVLPSTSTTPQVKPTRGNGFVSPVPSTSAWNSSVNRMRHSSSAPNLVEGGSSSNQSLPSSCQPVPKVEDVHTANKSLVERIRAGLGMDEDKFAAFKSISAEYRQDIINTWEYLSYVEQFGLSHLVLELAQLCPDAQKRKELIDAYSASTRVKGQVENGESDAANTKENKLRKKGKGKGKGVDHAESGSASDALADSFLSTVRKLQSNHRAQEDKVVEVLSKDGYRAGKGKLQESTGDAGDSSESLNKTSGSNQNPSGGESSKQRRKTSKFHRVRLGDGSAAALLDLGGADVSPEHERKSSNKPSEGLPVRGVWRNGGGLRLVASQKDSSQ